uniref:CN hydrolase domain-containing protein n=1 Tax=Ascaris lumbricoides TaxID=6252 RepID=A0A0M3HYV7_ASCLU
MGVYCDLEVEGEIVVLCTGTQMTESYQVTTPQAYGNFWERRRDTAAGLSRAAMFASQRGALHVVCYRNHYRQNYLLESDP